MSDVSIFARITKVNEEQQTVEGWATDETIDTQYTRETIGDVIDYDATKKAVEGWSQWRNIREMHQPSAAGIAEVIKCDDSRRGLYIVAKIVDPVAWAKCKTGVYKGFSIGGRMKSFVNEFRKEAGGYIRRVTDYVMTEISLVDNPANPAATFTMVKRSEQEALFDPNGVPLPKDVYASVFGKSTKRTSFNFRDNAALAMQGVQITPVNLGERYMIEDGQGSQTGYSGLNGRNIAKRNYTIQQPSQNIAKRGDDGSEELYKLLSGVGSSIRKRGDHDQSTHGNRHGSTGGSSNYASPKGSSKGMKEPKNKYAGISLKDVKKT